MIEAEKVLVSIEAGMERLLRLGVFCDTGATAGQLKIVSGILDIRRSLEQTEARENMSSDRPVKTLGDDLE